MTQDFSDAASEPRMMSPLSQKKIQVLPKFAQKQRSMLLERPIDSQAMNSTI